MKSPIYMALCAVLSMGCAFAQDGTTRMPLVPADTQDPILSQTFNAIRSRGTEPSVMHRTVAHSPAIFKAYLELATALRSSAVVPRVDRELVILRTAQLAHARYEFTAHRPMALSCGMTEAQIDNLDAWKDSKEFTDRQRAILAYTDAMSDPSGVKDATFNALKAYFSPQEIVELTMTSAFYNMATQVTRALKIEKPRGVKSENTGRYGKC